MERWEYRSIALATKGLMGGKLDLSQFDEALNALGREGWELVASVDTNQAYGATRDVIAIFKRRCSV